MTPVEIIRKLVRPFIAVALTVSAVYFTAIKLLPPEILGTAFVACISFHFGERSALKKPGA